MKKGESMWFDTLSNFNCSYIILGIIFCYILGFLFFDVDI